MNAHLQAWSDDTDPLIALRKHCVGRKIPRFAKVNAYKVNIFYGIVFIQLVYSSFRCILSWYWQCVYVHSVTAAQSELNEARIWHSRPHAHTHIHVTFFNLYIGISVIQDKCDTNVNCINCLIFMYTHGWCNVVPKHSPKAVSMQHAVIRTER